MPSKTMTSMGKSAGAGNVMVSGDARQKAAMKKLSMMDVTTKRMPENGPKISVTPSPGKNGMNKLSSKTTPEPPARERAAKLVKPKDMRKEKKM